RGAAGRPAALLTGGPGGLRRWPITAADSQGSRLRPGPPRQLLPLPHASFGRSPDGRTRAAAAEEFGLTRIVDLETASVGPAICSHPTGGVRAISGDGRWAASC